MSLQDTQTAPKIQSKDFTWRPFPEATWVSGGISLRQDGPMSWGGSDAESVANNRRNYFKKLSLEPSRVVTAEQVHGAEIRHVREEDAGRGVFELNGRIPATDGLLTDIQGMVLTTLHADCAPIFYADSEHKAIGLAHAGWRGIIAGLPGKMLTEMEREFGSKPHEINVTVGPMICPTHYEVTTELAERFQARFGPQVVLMEGGKPDLDLYAAIVVNLLENGLNPACIPPRPSCTFENPNFASYRRDGPPARSMLAWMQVKTEALNPESGGSGGIS